MKSVRFSVFVTAVLAGVLLLTLPGYADQVTVFDLTTVYQPPQPQQPNGTASGTVTIDTTTGVVEAIDLSFAGEPGSVSPSTLWDVYGTPPNAFVEINESWITPKNAFYDVEIVLPVDTLVGYAGGSICIKAAPCYSDSFSGFSSGISQLESYSSGQLTPITPEPTSLILFGTGISGLVVIFRRKLFRRIA
jgi:hypothetical protein